jgi:hypothetical protein
MVLRNCSRRLGRANFSKLGWQANVIWRIAISDYIPLDVIGHQKTTFPDDR